MAAVAAINHNLASNVVKAVVRPVAVKAVLQEAAAMIITVVVETMVVAAVEEDDNYC
jgi:hypothetical protein